MHQFSLDDDVPSLGPHPAARNRQQRGGTQQLDFGPELGSHPNPEVYSAAAAAAAAAGKQQAAGAGQDLTSGQSGEPPAASVTRALRNPFAAGTTAPVLSGSTGSTGSIPAAPAADPATSSSATGNPFAARASPSMAGTTAGAAGQGTAGTAGTAGTGLPAFGQPITYYDDFYDASGHSYGSRGAGQHQAAQHAPTDAPSTTPPGPLQQPAAAQPAAAGPQQSQHPERQGFTPEVTGGTGGGRAQPAAGYQEPAGWEFYNISQAEAADAAEEAGRPGAGGAGGPAFPQPGEVLSAADHKRLIFAASLLKAIMLLLLIYATIQLASSDERPASPALQYLLAAACLGLALPLLSLLTRLLAGGRRGVLLLDTWLVAFTLAVLLFTAACAVWGVLEQEELLGLGCAQGAYLRCSGLRSGTLAVLVASVLAFVTFIIQLRRAASRQGIASVTGWVAGWVRGGDHSAVVLLLGAAGRSYSTGLVQGPRLAQVAVGPGDLAKEADWAAANIMVTRLGQVAFSVIALATAASIPMWREAGAFTLLVGATAASLAAAALMGAWQWVRVVQARRQDRGVTRGWSQATPARLLLLTRPYFLIGQLVDAVLALFTLAGLAMAAGYVMQPGSCPAALGGCSPPLPQVAVAFSTGLLLLHLAALALSTTLWHDWCMFLKCAGTEAHSGVEGPAQNI